MTAIDTNGAPAPSQRPAAATLPTIEIRFSPIYAWLLIVAGVIFFFLAVFLIGGQNRPLSLFIVVLSIAAIGGGNYWRQHLHVVARMTSRVLVLQRDGTVPWADIVEIEKKTLRVPVKGVRHESEYICIKLRVPRPAKAGAQGMFDQIKAAVTGYDIIVPQQELSCGSDYFIDECRKRMAAVTGKAS